jgi:asparagine synthase (glutamine-hydrolysing)
VLAHERLSIVDVNTGAQPILSESGRQALAVNGEIYNHQVTRARFEGRYAFRTHSDCEVILPLYLEQGPDFLDELSGMYAFCLYDEERDRWMMARDPIGIIPLYYGHDANGQLFVASEMKALMEVCNQVHEFPPGHYWASGQAEPKRWYHRDWERFENVANAVTDRAALRAALEDSVISHLMTDVPYGVLLSGGLDSPYRRPGAHSTMRVEDQNAARPGGRDCTPSAIGPKAPPARRKAADHIGTVHHGFTFTIQEGLDALDEVVYHLETYDVTSIRAATPMYLMARKIHAMGIKMVLSGEGADEIFGGYLYFHKAPNAQAFHEKPRKSRLHVTTPVR